MHIQDAQIIDETLSDSGKSFQQWIAGGIDKLTKGQKAAIITSSLIFADVVKDPDQLRSITDQNTEILNKYFDGIDYQKLVKSNDDLVKPLKERFVSELKSHVPVLLFGIGIGIVGTSISHARKSKNPGNQ